LNDQPIIYDLTKSLQRQGRWGNLWRNWHNRASISSVGHPRGYVCEIAKYQRMT